jgi:phosphatidylserine/phosphatidylglycerophosphate/cardiolipin synthase-like enzyme
MPTSAKRFYLCNLIPLWNIDEENMDVDWPVHHAYFNELIDMRADIKSRDILYSDGAGDVHTDLRIRFEINESDFLLSGGLNDHMATYSSHADYGSDITAVRPIRITNDFSSLTDEQKEANIWIQWVDAKSITLETTNADGTTTSSTRDIPKMLQVRCWWRVQEEDDVSGHPEFYYDIYVEGKLNGDKDFKLHERSDHELEGFKWNVTGNKYKGNVVPLVDGEYAFIKMLQLMDAADHSIHILNWKTDPSANLVVEPKYHADYLQIPGLDKPAFEALLRRHKPRVHCVSKGSGFSFYTASNGNLLVIHPGGIAPAAIQIDSPTNLDLPMGVQALEGGVAALVLDQLRSRLSLFALLPTANLRPIGREVAALPVAAGRALEFYALIPSVSAAGMLAGMINLVGEGNPWDGNPATLEGGLVEVRNRTGASTGMFKPRGHLKHPTDLSLAHNNIYITDTGNHRIRKVAGFNPANLGASLGTSHLTLSTLVGGAGPGDADGTAANAKLRSPKGIVFDTKSDRLIVADDGNHKLKAIAWNTGEVTTINIVRIDGVAGATLGELFGLAFNEDEGIKGTLYVSVVDQHKILKLDLDSRVATTLVGSAAGYADGDFAGARFNRPMGLSYRSGELLVADSENHVIRVVDLILDDVTTLGDQSEFQFHDLPITLADVLRRKAEQGTKVRLLMDGYGSGIGRNSAGPVGRFSVSGQQIKADLLHLNPNMRVFVQNSIQTVFDQGLNSYHEKMMVADGKWGVVGGIDFDDDKNNSSIHLRKHRTSYLWHDIAAFVEGKAALGLEEAFVRRWMLARGEAQSRDNPPDPLPEVISVVDRTDASIELVEAESVRTFDPTPVLGFMVNLHSDETKEILESYKRAILAARYYVYLEHQYIYYPEIGETCVQAMRDNPDLQIIWCIPFFTEETQDPAAEKAALVEADQFASAITDASQLTQNNQLRSQLAWHGFFRHRQMVEQMREIDADRFAEFSIRRLFPGSQPNTEMIYPHSKIILCDDRFFSIGSANANGRGFTKDGELNISSIAPAQAKAFRRRLWGEHLGFSGVALVQSDGSFLCVNGHHLVPGGSVRLQHPDLGDITRKVDVVDPTTGKVHLTGGGLDPALGRVVWEDPLSLDIPLRDVVRIWRHAAHSLTVFNKVQGKGNTNAAGHLVVPDHLAAVNDIVVFSKRIMLLNDEGHSSRSEPVVHPLIPGDLKVKALTSNTIEFEPMIVRLPDSPEFNGRSPGEIFTRDPFRLRLMSRGSGMIEFQILGLKPNMTDLSFDYHASWLARQPGGKRFLRAWEINPPEGIEYAGPGTILFSPWMSAILLGIPWFAVDFDPDEQARLDLKQGSDDIAFA